MYLQGRSLDKGLEKAVDGLLAAAVDEQVKNGADVIKVEPPVPGDWSRAMGKPYDDQSAASVILNRGKRSIVLDLKAEGDRATFLDLAAAADVLFGDYPFTGKTPYTWPRSNEQLPVNVNNAAGLAGCKAPLFPFGYGLGEADSAPIEWLEC